MFCPFSIDIFSMHSQFSLKYSSLILASDSSYFIELRFLVYYSSSSSLKTAATFFRPLIISQKICVKDEGGIFLKRTVFLQPWVKIICVLHVFDKLTVFALKNMLSFYREQQKNL